MKKYISSWLLTFCIVSMIASPVLGADWAIEANYTESCSCNAACPCLFGSPSTLGHCKGHNLIEIKKGHYNGVNLDGISVVTAFSLGKWLKIYMSENATPEQEKAALALLKLKSTFGMIYSGKSEILSQEKAHISIERTPTTVEWSVPTSTVKIEMMKGMNGKPIKIQNLPIAFMNDHTQYKSIINRHNSEGKSFKYSGTNGLTSKIDTSGKI